MSSGGLEMWRETEKGAVSCPQSREASCASLPPRCCTAVFCVPALSWTGFGGLIYTGDPTLLGAQCLGILVTIAFVGVGSLVIGLIVKVCFKGSLRVSKEQEAAGMDISEHSESAYPAFNGLD